MTTNSTATDRGRAVDELRRSRAYLAEAQKLSHTGSFGWTISEEEIFWSEETFRIFEYDLAVKPTVSLILQRTHPDDRDFVQKTIDLASSGRTTFDVEHRLLMPDGTVKYVHVVANAVQDGRGDLEYIGAVTDITKTRHAELQLRQSEQSLRLTLEVLPGLVWTMLPNGTVDFCNEQILSYCGKTLDQLQDLTCVWHPDEIEEKVGQLRRFLASGTPNEDEFRLLRHDGIYRWHQCRVRPLRDEAGEIIRWYGLLWDIDERKQAEEERGKAFDEVRKLRDQLYQENLVLKEEVDQASMFEEIVGCSDALRQVLVQVTKVAPTDSTVLITGETGTGKELIARAIHNRSRRSDRPFLRVNCAAIPQSLIASELFGHEKGAFTGATQRRLGRFELANGGTILLDEVGDLPPETQVALLRVLQEREIERVGGSQLIPVDVRVLAATNRNVSALIEAGSFRQDLFYRLNVFPIHVPSLRERVDDIPLLVEYLIERYAKNAGKEIKSISRKTMDLFQSYDWPGNIRELQNVIERAVVLSNDNTFRVDERWLRRFDSVNSPFDQSGRRLETQHQLARVAPQKGIGRIDAHRQKELIETALAKSGGRVAGVHGAAAILGIPRQTLDSKIVSLGIVKDRFKSS
ncbi:formate hydrogenlyase transcriptional activator [Silvibacterium bohemicum]|uniref:Formate hydrogenlyase transcriptional activator n=1 Tax=Silvibacterium bohemicum TaxID=1577686 RepID=A0A841JYI0_9BACT|nr:sigma 54-interacting transcriptional regulator [Silvibacterium bohemicum]MBB6143024.1 formate hydrogenlyase transcriptional activator [Silvibacterium bohemicum]